MAEWEQVWTGDGNPQEFTNRMEIEEGWLYRHTVKVGLTGLVESMVFVPKQPAKPSPPRQKRPAPARQKRR